MDIETGIYEQLINRLVAGKLNSLDTEVFHIAETILDKQEASRYLSLYLAETIRFVLNEVKDKDRPLRQIELSNKIINLLASEFENLELSGNIIVSEGRILQAVFSKQNFPYSNISERIKEITPYSRLSQSELFTGNPQGISLESEIRKEIASSDEICWLVSFIRYSGIRIFKKDLEEFTGSGRKLRVITTSYMGATEVKAVEFLASLPNSEVKVSYNADHERLHAKAYLFMRNSGFHTGYIGSSNISRSALTNGLEWNLKVTTKEISHVIDKFRKTFDTYWEDKEFEHYRAGSDRQKLSRALAERPGQDHGRIISFFDIDPYPYQNEVLSRLTSEREIHNRYRNLMVAATGTGKTIISAFDFKRFRKQKPDAKLLYVAHRKEILQQSQFTFQQVLRDANFGELWVDGMEPVSYDQVFASVQTLNNRIADLPLDKDFYDFIIIDEVHHIAANSYRPVLKHFEPSILLGLTATPERMDGADILKDFSDIIATEIRLPEALNRKLLCPFQYFGISDSVDISRVSWRNGKYDVAELTRLYTGEKQRVGDIINNCEKYLTDINDVRTLGFCVSQKHASYMAEQFNAAGLKAGFLTSENASGSREELRDRLSKKEINYLFVVDIFNEGVDIPEIDTVLFLRPTESLTIFLQQLGRGLRLARGKECLTVLDFVGNARPEYDFEHKFRALVGRTNTPVLKEIQDDFPHLPIGCSIILERRAKEIILENIRAATSFRKTQILQKIQNFRHQSTLPLSLKNFLEFNHMERPQLYRRGSWKRLCADAGVIPDFSEPNEKEITRFLQRRLPGCNSLSYLKFVKRLILENFTPGSFSEEEELMLVMFHYDMWQKSGAELGFVDFRESVKAIKANPVMAAEMLEVTDYLISEVEVVEKELDLGYPFPLRLHSRYNRDQIMAALRLHTFESASSNREGVARQQTLNTEALFITLNKSEKEYSPTTMYEDYALNEYLFHWQSQNSASPESPVGLSYIKHRERGKKILLFVREQNKDEYGLSMSYVFLGEASFVKSYGARPMSIEWRLAEPIPASLLKESRKLVG